jgi:hypothetical protein
VSQSLGDIILPISISRWIGVVEEREFQEEVRDAVVVVGGIESFCRTCCEQTRNGDGEPRQIKVILYFLGCIFKFENPYVTMDSNEEDLAKAVDPEYIDTLAP